MSWPMALAWASMGLAASTPTASDAPRATIEARQFTKTGRVHFRLGASYLAREDFWVSPGLTTEVGYYFIEPLGLELSTTVFFSTLAAAAEELRRTQGLLPDAEQPVLRIVLGPRWAFAYGKVLLEPSNTVLHFDLGVALRLGAMGTNRGVNAGGDVAVGLQVGFAEHFLAWAEVSVWVGYEDRQQSTFSVGPAFALGVGVQLGPL